MTLPTGPLLALAAGLGTVTLGSPIRARGWTSLAAGYDDSADVPADVSSTVVGTPALRVGLATIALGGQLASAADSTSRAAAFVAVVCLDAGRAADRLRRSRPERAETGRR